MILAFLFLSCNEVKKQDTVQKTIDTPKATKQIAIDTVANKSADPILAIRKIVTHINTTKLKHEHFEFMCDETMQIDRFYENNQIVKIIVDYGTIGDVYAREEYYYDKGKLLFIYEFVEGGPACEGCIKKNEYRSYIQNDQVIKYLKDTKKMACRQCEFGPKSKQYRLLKAKTQEEVKGILCR